MKTSVASWLVVLSIVLCFLAELGPTHAWRARATPQEEQAASASPASRGLLSTVDERGIAGQPKEKEEEEEFPLLLVALESNAVRKPTSNSEGKDANDDDEDRGVDKPNTTQTKKKSKAEKEPVAKVEKRRRDKEDALVRRREARRVKLAKERLDKMVARRKAAAAKLERMRKKLDRIKAEKARAAREREEKAAREKKEKEQAKRDALLSATVNQSLQQQEQTRNVLRQHAVDERERIARIKQERDAEDKDSDARGQQAEKDLQLMARTDLDSDPNSAIIERKHNEHKLKVRHEQRHLERLQAREAELAEQLKAAEKRRDWEYAQIRLRNLHELEKNPPPPFPHPQPHPDDLVISDDGIEGGENLAASSPTLMERAGSVWVTDSHTVDDDSLDDDGEDHDDVDPVDLQGPARLSVTSTSSDAATSGPRHKAAHAHHHHLNALSPDNSKKSQPESESESKPEPEPESKTNAASETESLHASDTSDTSDTSNDAAGEAEGENESESEMAPDADLEPQAAPSANVEVTPIN